METLERYTPVSKPMRQRQRKKKSVLSAASSLYKSRTTGLVHSDFSDPQFRMDQYQRSGRNRSSDHILLLARNLDSTTTSPDSSMQQTPHTSVTCRRRARQGPPADYHRHWYATDDSQATDDKPDHPSQATVDQPLRSQGGRCGAAHPPRLQGHLLPRHTYHEAQAWF